MLVLNCGTGAQKQVIFVTACQGICQQPRKIVDLLLFALLRLAMPATAAAASVMIVFANNV